jgi:hypothetical protein
MQGRSDSKGREYSERRQEFLHRVNLLKDKKLIAQDYLSVAGK